MQCCQVASYQHAVTSTECYHPLIGHTENMEYFIFILMITGISASLRTNITAGRSWKEGSVRQCDKEGLMCKDCKTLVYCQEQDFKFVEYKVTECLNDIPCDETKQACTVGGTCRYKEFKCPYNLQKDLFLPDPYACTNYWWCGPGSYLECESPSSYNPITTECDLLVQENPYCLQDPLPPCQYNGQKLEMKGTPFTYECMGTFDGPFPIIYPYLIVDSSTSPIPSTSTTPTTSPKPTTSQKPTDSPTSTDSPKPTTSPPPTNPTTPSKPTTTSEPPTSTETPDPYPCRNPGYYPYPPECHQYFWCVKNADGSFKKTMMKCRIGAYFDKNAQKCVRGSCTNSRR